MDTIIITHIADADGIISGAFIAAMMASKGESYELRFADYPNLVDILATASKEIGKKIYILDLALEDKVPDDHIKLLIENNEVHYFDHHAINPERRNILESKLATFNSSTANVCTATLIAEYYNLDGTEFEISSNCAQGTDYPGTVDPALEALGRELNLAIFPESGFFPGYILEMIRQGFDDPGVWRKGYNLSDALAKGADNTRKAIEKSKPLLEKSVTLHEFFSRTDKALIVAFGLGARCLSQKPGYEIVKENFPEADVCVVLYETVSIFAGPGINPKHPEVPVLAFLIEIGGGGRDNMGGYQFATPTHKDNYVKRREELLEKYKRFLEQTGFVR